MHRKVKLLGSAGGWLCALAIGGYVVFSATGSGSVVARTPEVLDVQVDAFEDGDPSRLGSDLLGDDESTVPADEQGFEDLAGDLFPGQDDLADVPAFVDEWSDLPADESYDDSGYGYDDQFWSDGSDWTDDSDWTNEPTTTTVPPTTTTVPPTTTTVPPTTTAPPRPTSGWCDPLAVPRTAAGPVALVRNGGCLRAEVVVAAAGQTVDDAVAAARARTDVVSVGPINRVRVDTVDPLRSEQWALDALHTDAFVAAPNTSRLAIAVIDTGVSATHPDLAGVVLSGYDALAGGAGNTDANGHGTVIAGIASAETGNGIGIAGFGGRPRILPVRAIDDAGFGTSLDVAVAIDWAVVNGAHVINLSLGTPNADEHLRRAVERAVAAGVVVVASAGNGGALGDPVSYPASLPGVIAVASVDRLLTRSAFSTAGSFVAVAAPGRDIVSTGKDGTYVRSSGTSLAAAHVSAAAAVLLGDGVAPALMRTLLMTSADDLGPVGFDPATGAGLVDVPAARLLIPQLMANYNSTTTTTRPSTTTTTTTTRAATSDTVPTTTAGATTTTSRPAGLR